MSSARLEVIEIATGKVVHAIPCPDEVPGTQSMERLISGVLNNIGRFDCRLSRASVDVEDNRLDTDRYFVRRSQ